MSTRPSVQPKIGVTLPVFNTPVAELAELARLAEQAGLHSVWGYEIWTNPYVPLTAVSLATKRVSIGTALATAFSRTPWLTASSAADLHDASGGRFVLGLGTGDPFLLSNFHGLSYDKPLSRMRDYVGAIRAGWKYLASGVPGTYEGPFYKLTFPEFNPWLRKRPGIDTGIPIYLAAARPKMIQLAAEIADGLVGYLYSRKFLERCVLPNLEAGARRAGRDVGGIGLVSQTICSVSKDRGEAIRRAKVHVGMYVANAVSDAMSAFEGLEREVAVVREAIAKEGPAGAARATDEKLVDAFSISGTPAECRKRLQEYGELLPHVMLHTPYPPPLNARDSRDAFLEILEAFGS